MNLEVIETLLVKKLQRLLKKQVDVRPGPVSKLALGGMRETVFIHAARFIDHSSVNQSSMDQIGISTDEARVGRQPFRKGRVSGITEQRPCHIVVEISCIATAYSLVKSLSGVITPTILLTLAGERAFALGESAKRQSSLVFADFQAHLSLAETVRQEDDGIAFHRENLIFQLNGTLHVLLSKHGGLKAKRQPVKKILKKTIKKPLKKNDGKVMKKPINKTNKKIRQ